MPKKDNITTTVIDNFGARLTRYAFGNMNSGFAKYYASFGNDPFRYPGQLSWQETAIQIDAAGSVITDLIMDGQERVESGVVYVYAIGHTGRLYKIQVNDPVTYNPDYDNPVLLATLTINTPTFTRGGSIDFFGSTERIYIGHDKGVTRIDFDGTNETFVGALGSWTQTVPRQLKQFIGKLYAANGSNLAEIDSTGTVSSYTRLSPGFPDNTQVRDLDQSNDGNYLLAVVTRLALGDITSAAVDTTINANLDSYIFKWNGTDNGYTAFDSYPYFSLNANVMFGDSQYVFGYDLTGASVYNPTQKILTNILTQVPLPNAVSVSGNIVGWTVPQFYNGFLRVAQYLYGKLDEEYQLGWWQTMGISAQGGETDVMRIPFQMLVSDFVINSVVSGYQGGVSGTGKQYYSTLETSPAPTTKYKFYKIYPVATGFISPQTGVYETQTQMFSKRVGVKEIRVYGNPWVAGNSFKIDIIGSDGNPITNGSYTFTAGSTMNVGDDFVWYNPAMDRTYAIGIRVTQLGTTNFIINKIEVDTTTLGE